MKVFARPSRIFGTCPAGHQTDDEFMIEGTIVRPAKGPICYVALSAFTVQVTQIQRRERMTSHLSCPGCSFNPNKENRVVFVLGHEDTWELSQKYSEYNWARIDGRETRTSQRYRDRCWKLTQEGNYTEAERAIEQAIKHLKPHS